MGAQNIKGTVQLRPVERKPLSSHEQTLARLLGLSTDDGLLDPADDLDVAYLEVHVDKLRRMHLGNLDDVMDWFQDLERLRRPDLVAKHAHEIVDVFQSKGFPYLFSTEADQVSIRELSPSQLANLLLDAILMCLDSERRLDPELVYGCWSWQMQYRP